MTALARELAVVVPAHIRAGPANLPKSYEAAKAALANCVSIDECKDWADKAAALASYAKQANDEEMMKMVARIRARAIRRVGEFLKQIEAETPREYPTPEALIEAYRDYAQSHKAVQAPTTSGVYAFWSTEGRCMYVGESKSLRGRIQAHPRKRELPGCSIRWLACANHKQAEKWLIAALQPLCNGITAERIEQAAKARDRHSQTPLSERLDAAWGMLFGENLSEAIGCRAHANEIRTYVMAKAEAA